MSAVERRLKFLCGKCRGQDARVISSRPPAILDYSAYCWTAVIFNPLLGYFAFWAQRRGLQALREGRRKDANHLYLLAFVCIAVSIVVTVCVVVLALTEYYLATREAMVAMEMSKQTNVPKSEKLCIEHFSKHNLEPVNANEEKNCETLRNALTLKHIEKVNGDKENVTSSDNN